MGTPAKSKQPAKQVEYPIFEMEGKGKLILPPEIISQITYLHSHCGTDEWSGLLMYDVVKGNPSDPDKFELEAKHIFLMDIGTGAATDYEPDGDIVDIFDEIPEAMEWKIGHIHTHHSGGAYFSATDMGELQDNVDKHNYYLSLVVNFNGNYSAKVVFLSEMETIAKMNYLDDSGNMKNFKKTKKEKHMVSITMRIFYGEVGGFFSKRLGAVKKKKEDATKAAAASRNHSFGGGHHVGGFYGNNGNNWNSEKQRRIPATHQRAIGSKIIPDKMTSWEIDQLTRNVLMFDQDLQTQGNTYAILHQISNESDVNMDMYYEYLTNSTEDVIDSFFDVPLDDDEYLIVLNEIIMCITKYEGHVKLGDTVAGINDVLNMLGQIRTGEGQDVDEDEADIAKKLAEMEGEIT